MSNWKPYRAQITFLAKGGPAGGAPLSVADLYEFVWKEKPQSFQQVPNALTPAVASATVSGISQTCTISPGRIDVSLAPDTSQLSSEKPFPQLIDDVDQFWTRLDQIVAALTRSDNPVPASYDRTAVYVQLMSVEKSAADVNKTLLEVIPPTHRLPLTDEDGVILQFGTRSTVPDAAGATVGCLQKWSAELIQMVQFGVPAGAPGIGQMATINVAPQISKYFCASYAVECNTGAVDKFIPAQYRSAVMRHGLMLVTQALKKAGPLK
jgi:hypothetical protein